MVPELSAKSAGYNYGEPSTKLAIYNHRFARFGLTNRFQLGPVEGRLMEGLRTATTVSGEGAFHKGVRYPATRHRGARHCRWRVVAGRNGVRRLWTLIIIDHPEDGLPTIRALPGFRFHAGQEATHGAWLWAPADALPLPPATRECRRRPHESLQVSGHTSASAGTEKISPYSKNPRGVPRRGPRVTARFRRRSSKQLRASSHKCASRYVIWF